MRFFTPELYRRFNAADDAEADRADADWEAAIAAYQQHLDGLRDGLPAPVAALAALCLHDAELLDWKQEIGTPAAPPWHDVPAGDVVAILSLRQGDELVSLIYFLWDRVHDAAAPPDWPYSNVRRHWLYDEIDAVPAQDRRFLHRILLSDGTVMTIPFTAVVSHRLSLAADRIGDSAKQSA